jgi:spartin
MGLICDPIRRGRHKYGPEAERAAQLLGGSVHNVALVYVDVRGVGRKTLIKSGKKGMKGVIKTRLESGEEVILKPEGEGEIQLAHGGKVSQDVTVQLDKPSVGTSTALHGPGERANLQRRLESLALDEKKKAM